MTLGDTNPHSVYYNHPPLQHSSSIVASNGGFVQSEADYAADTESVTTAETVIPWSKPPPTQHRNHENFQPEATASEPLRETAQMSSHVVTIPGDMQLEEDRVRLRETRASQRPIIDELDSASPTPDTDDTPYIRYALEQLTKDEHLEQSHRPGTTHSEEYPVDRMIPDQGLGYVQPAKRVSIPAPAHIGSSTPESELFIPVEPQLNSTRYPDLTFIPTILRPFSMIGLVFLCLLMTVALIFCAVYSTSRNGLVDYNGGLLSSQYFLFQFVPQILAAIILLYLECIFSAVTRVVPFTMMASDNTWKRSNALFVDLYPRGLFWPRFDYFSSGETLLGVCSVMLWPIIFTIPLQSSLFSVINVDGVWKWTAVQGVVWTLIAVYILGMISVALIGWHFFRRSTGLIWDPRSLADVIALLPRSNILDEYQDTEGLPSKTELRTKLSKSSERLGYWRTNHDLQEIFYCIGEEGAPTRRHTIQEGRAERTSQHRTDSEQHSIDVEGLSANSLAGIRFRHIPWYLNDTLVLLWPVAGFFLVLALLIVSFLPSTALRKGFIPLVPAAPDSAGFSPANFLYSFMPSTLGLLIYCAFRSLSLMLYHLAPWVALSNPHGAIASESILLDYTASIPLVQALTNGHNLVAFISVVAPLTILLPILAGGLFFPIQIVPSNVVVMLPNLPSFYITIVVLILAVIGLIAVAVSLLGTGKRRRYRLPHSVSCLAEIISFVYASSLVHDAAFRAVRSKANLRARLIGRRERGSGSEEVRYGFGMFKGRDGESHLGIERMRRVDKIEWPGSHGKGHERSRSRFST